MFFLLFAVAVLLGVCMCVFESSQPIANVVLTKYNFMYILCACVLYLFIRVEYNMLCVCLPFSIPFSLVRCAVLSCAVCFLAGIAYFIYSILFHAMPIRLLAP